MHWLLLLSDGIPWFVSWGYTRLLQAQKLLEIADLILEWPVLAGCLCRGFGVFRSESYCDVFALDSSIGGSLFCGCSHDVPGLDGSKEILRPVTSMEAWL